MTKLNVFASTIFTLIAIIYFSNIYVSPFLMNDDVAVFFYSTNNPLAWFVDGYQNYFINYHEWTNDYTNYLRPVGNLYVFLAASTSALNNHFHPNWLIFIISGLIIIRMTYAQIQNTQKSNLILFLVTITVIFYPPFHLSQMTHQYAFALDALAFLFTLALIYNYQNEKSTIIFVILSLMCLYTKETAIPVITALLFHSLLKKRYTISFLTLFLLLGWLVHRKLVFSGFVDGAQTFNSMDLKYRLTSAIKLLFIPFYNVNMIDIKDFIRAEFSYKSLLLILNFLVLSFIFMKAIKNVVSSFYSLTPKSCLLDIIVLSNFIFFLGIGGSARLSYILYGYLIVWTCSLNSRKAKLLLITILPITAALSSLPQIRDNINQNTMLQIKNQMAEKLKNTDVNGKYNLVNDILFGFSDVNSINNIYKLNIASKINNLDINKCKPYELEGILVTKDQNTNNVTITVPRCATIYFAGVSPQLLVNNLANGQTAVTSNNHYTFPEVEHHKGAFTNRTHITTFGDTFSIKANEGRYLYYDFSQKQWRLLE